MTKKWTHKQLNKLSQVQSIIQGLQEYLPLTLRQIHYQMVSRQHYENTQSQYVMLSGLLRDARIAGLISWDVIEDRVRFYHDLSGWPDCGQFVKAHAKAFLEGYNRDLMQTQNVYLEIWIEKDALSSFFIRAATPYTVPVVVCRGFSSVSFLNDFRNRIESCAQDRSPIMLYFGDFDPSGLDMLRAMEHTLVDDFGLNTLTFKRIALLESDVDAYRLPHNPSALKKTDPRARNYIAAYGELAVELDALQPDVLEQKIHRAILDMVNQATFDAERKRQQRDLNKLKKIKKTVLNSIKL